MNDVPEFHGNPNDLDFNPEFVFQLKAKLSAVEKVVGAAKTLITHSYYGHSKANLDVIERDSLEKALKEYKDK